MAETVKLGTHPDRVESLLDDIARGVRNNETDQSLISVGNQQVSAQLAQTQALVNGLSSQTATLASLLQEQATLLEQLKTTYSETIELTVSGVSSVIHPAIASTYQTYELVSVDANFATGAEVGDRYLTLERVRLDNSVIGANWQTAALPPSSSRGLTWAKDAGNDNWSRVSIPQFPIPVASGIRWQLRNIGTVGTDTITATFFFRVYAA